MTDLLVDWDNSYLTSNKLIDQQHKRILSSINLIITGLCHFWSEDCICELIDDLSNQLSQHFFDEEEFLRDIKYIGFEKHIIEHDNMTLAVAKVISDIKKTFSEYDALKIKVIVIDHFKQEDSKWIIR